MDPVTLETQRRRLFQAAFDEFDQSGNWPSVPSLARRLVEEMDVHEVLQDLPQPWGFVETGNAPTLVLRPPAIAICKGAEQVIQAFLRTLQLAVELYFGQDQTPEFTQGHDAEHGSHT